MSEVLEWDSTEAEGVHLRISKDLTYTIKLPKPPFPKKDGHRRKRKMYKEKQIARLKWKKKV